jgi:hypothetical protein
MYNEIGVIFIIHNFESFRMVFLLYSI